MHVQLSIILPSQQNMKTAECHCNGLIKRFSLYLSVNGIANLQSEK